MLELEDYLGVTERSAGAQWQRVLSRSPLAGGLRQEDYLPIETLLCYGLGLIGTITEAGNVSVRESSPAVLALSALLKRTPKSLAAKVANLDGRRPHGAKNEQLLWIELATRRGLYDALYQSIVAAARLTGISATRLPDFIGVEDHSLQSIADADQISTEELREAIEPELTAVLVRKSPSAAALTERALVATARVGQQQFARQVLNNAAFECVFCGLGFKAAGLPSSRMLVASHIKAWKDSDNVERLDPGNGLAACPTHDAAFEAHLYTITPDFRVLPTHLLRVAMEHDQVIARNFGPGGMYDRLPTTESFKPPGEVYLAWHRMQANA